MKFFRHLSFLLLVSIFFIQCKKKNEPEPVTFSGNVSDNVQGIPVANATVKIKLQQSASTLFLILDLIRLPLLPLMEVEIIQ